MNFKHLFVPDFPPTTLFLDVGPGHKPMEHVLPCCRKGHLQLCIPTLLKIKFEGGSRTEISFYIYFLNDQHSSSFDIIGKQVKIKYLRLAPEELSTCQTEAAHV